VRFPHFGCFLKVKISPSSFPHKHIFPQKLFISVKTEKLLYPTYIVIYVGAYAPPSEGGWMAVRKKDERRRNGCKKIGGCAPVSETESSED
jgi:hypothetical protein